MTIKKHFAFIVALQLLVMFGLGTGCSKEKEEPASSLLKKVREIDQAMEKKYPRKRTEYPLYEKKLAVAEKCSEIYGACIDRCAGQKTTEKCDARCKEDLAKCEKPLPDNLKTRII